VTSACLYQNNTSPPVRYTLLKMSKSVLSYKRLRKSARSI